MPPRSSIGDAARRFLHWSATPSGLAVLFAVGLAIRLILARGGGFPYDISSFASWADRLATRGPWNFYPHAHEKFFVDYPPGYLYVLWLVGVVSRALGGGAPSTFWLKVPPIGADLALAWVVGSLAVRLAPAAQARRFPIRGVAVTAVLLNPAIFFISSVWGQADAFLALLVAGSYLLLGTGPTTFRREAGGVALLAVAIGTKPQAIFVLPVIAMLLVWRHVRWRVADSRRPALLSNVAAGVGRVAALGAVGVAAGLVLVAPFRMGPLAAVRFYAHASSTYSVTSVFAFNGWGVVGFWRPDVGPQAVRLFGISAFFWGLGLFSILGALVLARAWLSLQRGEHEGRVLVFGSAAITLVGFAVLTRIHERYLFLPLALLAVFVGTRWLRRAFVVMSGLYLINTFFPYVYYLKFVGRPAPTLGGFVDVFYGTDIHGAQLRLLSVVTAVACLFVAARGWRALSAAEPEPDVVREVEPLAPDLAISPVSHRWQFQLHPVGRRGVVLAFAAFLVALGTRLPGLGHPPGMYFDEVYHARTGAEYIGRKEVFEWTHPPLAKELIALSIRNVSGFGSRPGGKLPAGVLPDAVASRPDGFVWAQARGDRTLLYTGRLDESCSLVANGAPSSLALRPLAVGAGGNAAFVAGVDREGPTIVRVDNGELQWSAPLPQPARQVVALGERAFVLTTDGALISISPEGEPTTLAVRAGAIAVEPHADPSRGQEKEERVVGQLPQTAAQRGVVWASFPQDGRVASWDADAHRSAVIEVAGSPNAITAPDDTDRLLVGTGVDLAVIDSKTKDVSSRLSLRPQRLATIPETELAWAEVDRQLHVIEPRSGVVIGRIALSRAPATLVPDPVAHQMVAMSRDGLECASGRPQFAWRLGSAVFGSAMVGLVALLALRLFGSLWLAGLASLFLAVEGLAFTMSRIAIPESYTTAFLLASWFAVLSAFYRWGGGLVPRSRGATTGWLLAAGLFGGLGAASKWVAIYGYAAIILLIFWDAFARGREGLWRLWGGVLPSAAVLVLCLGAVPLAVYVLTYIPYFSLGHSFGDLIRLQAQMYGYHAHLTASHPFSAPWFGWPFGYRAVFLYLGGSGTSRAEIWTIPNLVVFWGGLLALGAMALEARVRRSVALAVVVAAAVIQVLPWVTVSRVLFLYHYLPVVPFLAIALAWWLVFGLRESNYQRPVAIGVAVLAVAFFVAVLPMLEGWTVPVTYLDQVRHTLPWVIP